MEDFNDNLHIENYVDFEHDILSNAMDWAVDNIFQRIWLDDKWSKPAKGGRHPSKPAFELHRDMEYQSHIFTGCAMALRILDYYFNNHPEKLKEPNMFTFLKRAIFGFLFHDYNKLTGTDFLMRDKNPLFNFIENTFQDVLSGLGITKDDVYQIATYTEKGTSFNGLSNNMSTKDLQFEFDFSRLADSLSGRYNDGTSEDENDIKIGPETIVSGKRISHLLLSNTGTVALTDQLKKSCINVIKADKDSFYLWSDLNKIYYITPKQEINRSVLREEILKTFSKDVKKSMRPEKLLRLSDRSVDNGASGFLEHSRESMKSFIELARNLKMCIHLEDIKLDTEDKIRAGEEYTNEILKYPTHSFSINFKFTRGKEGGHSLRDGLDINDYEESQASERLNIFMLRYVQLKSTFISPVAKIVRDHIQSESEEINKLLVGKEPLKSVLIFPKLLNEKGIQWDCLLEEILKDLNLGIAEVNYEVIAAKIMPSLFNSIEFPDVPSKFSMSMVNGYPGKENAKGDKLFGIRTNGFNNRLPTSRISNGKVDQLSIYEFGLRRNSLLNSDKRGTLTYLRFPSAIPHMNLGGLLKKVSGSGLNETLIINNIDLDIESENHKSSSTEQVRLYDSILISSSEIDNEESILRALYNTIDIAKKTKMHARVTFTNAPIFEDQYETIRIDISSSILSFFSWNAIRCNEMDQVKETIQTFNVIGNGSLEKIDFKHTSEKMLDYIQNPLSIFSHVHNLLFKNGDNSRRGFGKQFSQRIEDIRKLGYEVIKRGEEKMKRIEKLAGIASGIKHANWNMSASVRTEMIRDSLDAIEVARAKTKEGSVRKLSDYEDIVGGVILTKLRRDSERNNSWIPLESINEFSKTLIEMLEEDFSGKTPSGALKSYIINAYEFEYMLTIGNKGGKQNDDRNE